MKAFAAVSMLVTLVVTTVIGVRMLLVARKTRQLPELLFGFAFIFGGGGQGFMLMGQRMIWTEPGLVATTMNALLYGLVMLGSVGLYVVVWRVFQPSARGAGVAAIGTMALLVGYGMRLGAGEFADSETFGNGMRVILAARISLFCWIAMEAFHHASQLARRAQLGLADALTALQIRLWGVTGATNMLLTVMVGWYTMELHRSPLDDFWSVCAILAAVAISSTSMWVAFFPPAGLAARVRAHGAASSTA